jgi:hypothetical protein
MWIIGACALVGVGGIVLATRTSRAHADPVVHDRMQPAATAVRLSFEATLDSLSTRLDSLERALAEKNESSARGALADARRLYKRN